MVTCAAWGCRGRTVGLTLWGESAEVQGAELEQSEDAIVSVSSCRVGDYNGAPGSHPQASLPAFLCPLSLSTAP